jgi:galactose oxidase
MYSQSFSVYITAGLSAGAVGTANLGQWGPSVNLPMVPVAAAVLHDTGDLLMRSAYSDNAF